MGVLGWATYYLRAQSLRLVQEEADTFWKATTKNDPGPRVQDTEKVITKLIVIVNIKDNEEKVRSKTIDTICTSKISLWICSDCYIF